MGEAGRRGRKVRRRMLLRWSGAVLALLVLAASLTSVVRRGEAGRRLTAEAAGLEAEARIIRDRIGFARTRIDSLSTPARIERIAAAIGLQRAEEAQILQVDAASSRDEEGGDR